MVFIYNLLPIFFVLSLIVVVYSFVKERAIVRATGMSESSPVCAKCHYRLGGWSSSICPECGKDVREVGVRVSAKSSRLTFGFVFFFVSFATITPLAVSFFGWAFNSTSRRIFGGFGSSVVPRLVITTETTLRWQRFPQRDTKETQMGFVYFSTGAQASEAWWEGHLGDTGVLCEQTITLTETSWLSGDNEIEHAVRQVLEPNESKEVIAKHVHSLKELSKSILDSYAEGIEEYEVISTWSDSTLNNLGTGYFATGRTNADAQDRITLGVAPISFVFCLLLSLQLTKMFIKPYSRVPRENEWKMLNS